MGLFGSKKKPRDPFEAAVEQQRRRSSAKSFGQRQSSSHQRSTDYCGYGGPSAWHKSTNVHPYRQPGFGFYSGENLAGRPRHSEQRRSVSVDEGSRVLPPGFRSTSLGRDLPFSPNRWSPEPDFRGRDRGRAGGSPWLYLDPWTGLASVDSPYAGPEEQFIYPHRPNCDAYVPGARMPPLRRSVSSNSRLFAPPYIPSDFSTYSENPNYAPFRPFSDPAVPEPYVVPMSNRDVNFDRHLALDPLTDRRMDPLPDMRATGRPPRPHGSYERLRPPHLQRGTSRAGSGRCIHSSNSNLGGM